MTKGLSMFSLMSLHFLGFLVPDVVVVPTAAASVASVFDSVAAVVVSASAAAVACFCFCCSHFCCGFLKNSYE